MNGKLRPLQEVKELIEKGATLVVSGHETLLAQLPKGRWIGATLSRFLDVNGGVISDEQVFAVDLSAHIAGAKICTYSEKQVDSIPEETYSNGFSYIILPAFSGAHMAYGIRAVDMPNIFQTPIVGFVAGFNPDDPNHGAPKVFDGSRGAALADSAVVMHCELPQGKLARLEIISPFQPGDGDDIMFEESSFKVKECLVNGVKQDFAKYIERIKMNPMLPFVANLNGALINVNNQGIENGTVQLAAATIPHAVYRVAAPLPDYVEAFRCKVPTNTGSIVSTVNCHANYEYLELKGKKLGNLTGPFAFGEIAYLLLNQTTVNLFIE